MNKKLVASTIGETLDLLHAAEKEIEAAVLALTAGGGWEAKKDANTTPLDLSIELDLSVLTAMIAEKHAFAEQIRGIER